MHVAMDRGEKVRERQLRKTYANAEKAAKKAERDLQDQRFEISAKETELLLAFRELMAYDFHVADHYFNREELLRRKQNKAA